DSQPTVRNHDRLLHRVCEHLDHALLHGLQHIPAGYWPLVMHFTRSDAVATISALHHVTTSLGRSRAWLYLALNESSLESYLRLFSENPVLLRSHYSGWMSLHIACTKCLSAVQLMGRVKILLSVNDAPYLDLAAYMPDPYRPVLPDDLHGHSPSCRGSCQGGSCQGGCSDSASLESGNSANLEWDDSAIAPSSEGGGFLCTTAAKREREGGVTAAQRGSWHRQNPFSSPNLGLRGDPTDEVGGRAIPASSGDADHDHSPLEVIRLTTRRRWDAVKRPSSALQPDVILQPSALRQAGKAGEAGELGGAKEPGDESQPDTAQRVDTEPWQVGLVSGSEQRGANRPGLEMSRAKVRTSPVRRGTRWPTRTRSNGRWATMPWIRTEYDPQKTDIWTNCTTTPSTIDPPVWRAQLTVTNGNCAHDCGGTGHRDNVEAENGTALTGDRDAGGEDTETDDAAMGRPLQHRAEIRYRCKPTIGPACFPDIKLQLFFFTLANSGPCRPSQQTQRLGTGQEYEGCRVCRHVDNNLLLLLMLHVFREDEEQLYKMLKLTTGHAEGAVRSLFVVLTDCHVYLVRKGTAEKPFAVERATPYHQLAAVRVGVHGQAVRLDDASQRQHTWIDTAEHGLTEFLLLSLTAALVRGCREPPYPRTHTETSETHPTLAGIFVFTSVCQLSEVHVACYSYVHWEEVHQQCAPGSGCAAAGCLQASRCPQGPGCVPYKEELLVYRTTGRMGGHTWKPCYLVLSSGILYQYEDSTGVTPLMSLSMSGGGCGGCLRVRDAEQPHSFQVLLTGRPPLRLAARSEPSVSHWLQAICQAVSLSVCVRVPAVPGVLLLTRNDLFLCHEDAETRFIRSLGRLPLPCIVRARTHDMRHACSLVREGADSQCVLGWDLSFSCDSELRRFLSGLALAWESIFQASL
uniref:Pleckstrin homology domain containing, family M (with RUN domain) member 2 n=1 Tax=Petromyzon marinus TaxID=7757 RepID=S4R9S2_PETMA